MAEYNPKSWGSESEINAIISGSPLLFSVLTVLTVYSVIKLIASRKLNSSKHGICLTSVLIVI